MILLSETDSIKFREFLKCKLAQGVHEIVFNKKDGTVRVLYGTRDKDFIGAEIYEAYINPPVKEGKEPRKESTTSLPTYDSKAKQWRSFSLANLVSVDGINTETLLKQANIVK